MRSHSKTQLLGTLGRLAWAALLGAVMVSCGDATGPAVSLQLSTAPALIGTVTMAERESGNGPAGYYSQVDVWLAISPASDANAGVVVGDSTPVYVAMGTSFYASSANAIKPGDHVQVWHDTGVGYGAVQAPPGAPVYQAVQLVIER